MIDIAPVRVPRKTAKDVQFESFTEYRRITVMLIKSIAPRLHPSVRQQILGDEDTMNHMITAIMIADWGWNGKGSKHGYRKQAMVWAIKSYMTRRKRFKHNLSIFDKIKEEDEATIGDTIPSNDIEPAESVTHTDLLRKLKTYLGTDILTPIQKTCIQYKFFEELPLRAIASKVGLSYQMVSNHIDNALSQLKEAFHNDIS